MQDSMMDIDVYEKNCSISQMIYHKSKHFHNEFMLSIASFKSFSIYIYLFISTYGPI